MTEIALTEMMELANKDIKIVAVNMLHMYKNVETIMNTRRQMEDIKMTQRKLLQKDKKISDMKNTLDGINRTLSVKKKRSLKVKTQQKKLTKLRHRETKQIGGKKAKQSILWNDSTLAIII